ncbi:hypothetical protein VNI00_017904 [Paramarasmius palmivorus]|uniref:F-box domain-containing protein n=1 Tax=Paramarasmius palmivorus TaxID=297713 RepID=A0AAW0B1E3_9AGAR
MTALINLPHLALTPVYDALPIDNLFNARKVSSTVRRQIEEYTSVTFGLNRLYGSFFSSAEDILQFRLVQHETRALVSGTSLVYVLSRSGYPLTDLDVFLPFGCVEKFGLFLLRAGYRCSPVDLSSDDPEVLLRKQEAALLDMLAAGVRDTDKLVLTDGYKANHVSTAFVFDRLDGKRIQLVGTKTEPIHAILGFYSTLVMNVATSNDLISLYPNTSFVQHAALYVQDITPPIQDARKRNEERGWVPISMVSARTSLESKDELSFKTRWVGDQHCWVFPLPPLAELAGQPDAYRTLSVTSWLLHSPAPGTLRVVFNRLDSDVMRSQFVINWDEDREKWVYNCFRNMDGRFRWVTTASEGLNSMGDVDGYLGEFVRRDSSLARWACFYSNASPDEVFAMQDGQLHEDLVRFVSQLYPVLDDRYTDNVVLDRLREAFGRAFRHYTGMGAHVEHPTGHTVTVILQCLEEVLTVANCQDVDFTLGFTFDRDLHRVWTTFIIFVPSGMIDHVREDLCYWSTDGFRDAYMEVFIASKC